MSEERGAWETGEGEKKVEGGRDGSAWGWGEPIAAFLPTGLLLSKRDRSLQR